MIQQKENPDEFLAQDWLRRQGYKDIPRPCRDPPDFVVDRTYTVEVTRLNQKITVGNKKCSVGEEEARRPLTDHLKDIVCKLAPGNEGRSWIIDCEYDFSVPLPK